MNLPLAGLREHLLCDVDFNPLLSKCDTAHGVAQLWLGLTVVHPPPDGRGPGDGPTPLFHGVAIEGVNVPSHHDVKVVLTGGFHWKILAHGPVHLNLGGVEWEHAARAAEQPSTRCRAQDAVHKMLCTRCCAQDAVHKMLCTRCCAQDAVHKMLCTRCCAQDAVHKMLCSRCCAQDAVGSHCWVTNMRQRIDYSSNHTANITKMGHFNLKGVFVS